MKKDPMIENLIAVHPESADCAQSQLTKDVLWATATL
jgi:hypothetical protein